MTRDISIIAKNKPYAHHKTHLHTVKVYNTRPVNFTIEVVLIKIFFFSTTEVITSNDWNFQRFQAIEFMNRPVPEKLDMGFLLYGHEGCK